MDNNKQKPATLNQAEIDKIKDKYDCEVKQFIIGDKQGWFRTADLQILDAAQSQKSVKLYNKTLALNCFLAGDPEIIERDRYFINLVPKLDELTNFLQVEVKNC